MWHVPRWSHYGGERVYDWGEFYRDRVKMQKRKKRRQAKNTKRAAVQRQTSIVSVAEAADLKREVAWQADGARI